MSRPCACRTSRRPSSSPVASPRTGEDYAGSSLESAFGTLRVDWKLGGATVTATLGYLDGTTSNLQDIEGYGRPSAPVTLPAPGGIAEPLGSAFEFNTVDDVRQISQELRLGNLETGRTRCALGALHWSEQYRQKNETFATILSAPGASAALNTRLVNSNVSAALSGRDTDHSSIYGLQEHHFTDRLTVGIEARYYWEDFEYDFPTNILVLGAGTTPLAAPARPPKVSDIKLDAKYFAPKLTTEYRSPGCRSFVVIPPDPVRLTNAVDPRSLVHPSRIWLTSSMPR